MIDISDLRSLDDTIIGTPDSKNFQVTIMASRN